MDSKIIGNCNDFAVEFKFLHTPKYPSGNFRLWINNIAIGNFKEDVVLGIPLVNLMYLHKEARELPNEFKGGCKEEIKKDIFNKINNNSELLIKHYLELGGAAHEFHIYTFKELECIYFIWRACQYVPGACRKYSRRVNLHMIKPATINKVASQFKNEIINIEKQAQEIE